MATLRTFIALELPAPARQALATVQNDLRDLARQKGLGVGSALKWVDPEGIHLTLKFLGNVDESLVPELKAAVDAAADGRPAVRLRLAGLGAFPNQRQPRVLWVGIDGEVALVGEMQQRVEEGLTPLGFSAERRPFSPHLTLARVREQATPEERRAVSGLVGSGAIAPELSFVAGRLSLIRSNLHPTGARYEALHVAALA